MQRHVGSAICHNVWQYFQVSHDVEFLHYYGAEMILNIAASGRASHFDDDRGRYEIRGVMGPDEFHEAIRFRRARLTTTPIPTSWCVGAVRAQEVLDLLSDQSSRRAHDAAWLSAEEIARWGDISRRMYVPFHDDGIISQFEGYEDLRELDWEDYRSRTAIFSASTGSSRGGDDPTATA